MTWIALKNHKEFIKNHKLILKTQQRFKSEKHHVFTEEIASSSNDDERVKPINLIETYAYGLNKDLVCKKGDIKCNNIKTVQKCLNLTILQEKT